MFPLNFILRFQITKVYTIVSFFISKIKFYVLSQKITENTYLIVLKFISYAFTIVYNQSKIYLKNSANLSLVTVQSVFGNDIQFF